MRAEYKLDPTSRPTSRCGTSRCSVWAAWLSFVVVAIPAAGQDHAGDDNPLARMTRPPMTMVDAIFAGNESSGTPDHFDILLVGLDSLTDEQRAIFEEAEATWESLITGYDIPVGFNGPTIELVIEPIDGSGQILGSAGPDMISIAGGVIYTLEGEMRFDSADVADLISDGEFDEVVLHEMAHVLGFGTLWDNNALAIDESGEYQGLGAISEFDSDFVVTATGATPALGFVPVELDGGPGTRDGHWDETTVYEAANGQGPLANELMTGFINTTPPSAPIYIGDITLGQFRDLGFTTVSTVPIEPDPLDFTGDGSVDISDVVGYIDAFFGSQTMDPELDFNEDGSVDISDLVQYLNAFFAFP